MIGIYKLTSPSGKSYIGQSINIKNRFSKYKSCKCIQQIALYNAIRKYGFDNFKVEMLYESEYFDGCEKELNRLEFCFIIDHKTMYPSGYNLKDGGTSGGSLSDFTKKKIGLSNTGKKHPHSDATKVKISEKLKGRERPNSVKIKISMSNSGKTRTNNERLRLSTMNIGVKQSKKTIEKRIESLNKEIDAFLVDGSFVNTFKSINDASIFANIDRSGISKCLTGVQKTSGGYIWKYRNNRNSHYDKNK